ncbi:hypothetical protein V6Z11_A01G146700 [Gossypium hirsutum]
MGKEHKTHLPLFSKEQASFIAGRNITDNILIVQEVIRSLKSKHMNRNWMVVKNDLEKVYDRVH